MKQKNVDTGMGLERTLCILNGKANVYETDLFENAILRIEELSGLKYKVVSTQFIRFGMVADNVHFRIRTAGSGCSGGSPPVAGLGQAVLSLKYGTTCLCSTTKMRKGGTSL